MVRFQKPTRGVALILPPPGSILLAAFKHFLAHERDPRRQCTILADTPCGFRYKTSVPNTDKLSEFTVWCAKHITDDEKGQARNFSDSQHSEFCVA